MGENLLWGRKAQASWFGSFASLAMVTLCPLWVFSNWIGLEYFDGSITSELSALLDQGLQPFLSKYSPRPSMKVSVAYAGWLLFQAALYEFLPGPTSTGQLTPAGNLLQYKTNGLLAWTLTHVAFIAAGLFKIIDLAVIANHFEAYLYAMNFYGFLLSLLCLIKGYIAPTHPEDCKYSGSTIFDFFVGIELNPRLGNFDLKLFHNGRPGIIAWTLIDLSYTAMQYQKLGRVTNSMLLVDLFHFIYVIDFFVNEDWYLRTIDMSHDHYGFYLAWGSMAALPPVYSIQTQYLARYPVDLSFASASAILMLGLGGYVIFRGANHQKDIVRSTNGRCSIWGKKAEYIRCSFRTADGKTHDSLLLCSGWWGFSRHANYLGDVMMSFAMGAACGKDRFIPWCYTILLSSIFINRVPRDEARCARKYGKYWQLYCDTVPWRLLPGVF